MLLALDTSSRWMGIACYDGANVLYEQTWYSPHYHTAQLAATIDEALQRLGAQVGDVKAIGAAVGPGGFTGLRIGLALAKGLVLAGGMALIGIPSLDVLVAQTSGCIPGGESREAEDVCVAVLQAGRGRFASGFYRLRVQASSDGRQLKTSAGTWQHEKDEILTVEGLAERCTQIAAYGRTRDVLLCGELTQRDRIILEHHFQKSPAGKVRLAPPAYSLRRPSYLAELAWERWQAGQCDNPATLVPIYLT